MTSQYYMKMYDMNVQKMLPIKGPGEQGEWWEIVELSLICHCKILVMVKLFVGINFSSVKSDSDQKLMPTEIITENFFTYKVSQKYYQDGYHVDLSFT